MLYQNAVRINHGQKDRVKQIDKEQVRNEDNGACQQAYMLQGGLIINVQIIQYMLCGIYIGHRCRKKADNGDNHKQDALNHDHGNQRKGFFAVADHLAAGIEF